MTLAQLIATYRYEAVDEATPYLCSDDLLKIYANEAQDEACRRAQLLKDSSSAWCTVAVIADQTSITLNPLAIQVLRAFVGGDDLTLIDSDRMDSIMPGWQFNTTKAKPTYLVSGLDTGKLHLWPIPEKAYTIKLTVSRLPLAPMALTSDEPEIRKEAHRALVDWMIYRALSRPDVDALDPQKTQNALSAFEAEFGRKVSVRNEQWVREGQGMVPAPIA